MVFIFLGVFRFLYVSKWPMQACKSAVKSGERAMATWRTNVMSPSPGLCEYWRKGEHEEDNGNVSSSWSNGQ